MSDTYVNDIFADTDFFVEDVSQLHFLDDRYVHTISAKSNECKLMNARTHEPIKGLKKRQDGYEFLNLNSFDRCEKPITVFGFCHTKGKTSSQNKKYSLFAHNRKIYLLLMKANIITKTVKISCMEYEVVDGCLNYIQGSSEKYPLNCYDGNYVSLDRIRIGDLTYVVFTFYNDEKILSLLVDIANCDIYEISGELYRCHKANACRCHPSTLGYAEHTHKLLFVGTYACHVFDSETIKIHCVEPPTKGEKMITDIRYSHEINRYVFNLSSRILVFSEDYITNKASKTDLHFSIETKDDSVVLEACTHDKYTVYRKVVTSEEPVQDPSTSEFSLLKTILSDAISRKKKYVSFEYQITRNRYLDMIIKVDANYHKYTLVYTLDCVEHPFDNEIEIRKLREEFDASKQLEAPKQ